MVSESFNHDLATTNPVYISAAYAIVVRGSEFDLSEDQIADLISQSFTRVGRDSQRDRGSSKDDYAMEDT